MNDYESNVLAEIAAQDLFTHLFHIIAALLIVTFAYLHPDEQGETWLLVFAGLLIAGNHIYAVISLLRTIYRVGQ